MSLRAKDLAETFWLTASVMMKQQTKNNTAASRNPPSIRLKHHHSTTDTPGLDDNQRVVTRSNSSKSLGVSESATEIGIINYKFVCRSEVGCNLAPEEKLDPPRVLRACELESCGTMF